MRAEATAMRSCSKATSAVSANVRPIQIQMLGRDLAAIAPAGGFELERRIQLLAAQIEWRLALRLDFENPVLQVKASDGQLENGFHRIAGVFHLGLRQIGAAIGVDDQVDLGITDVQRQDIDVAFEERNDLESHHDGIGMQQHRFAGRFGAGDFERGDLGPHLFPIQVKPADAHAPAGGLGNRGDNAIAHLVVEPRAANDKHRRARQQQDQGAGN